MNKKSLFHISKRENLYNCKVRYRVFPGDRILAPGASGGHKTIRRCKNMAKINANYEAMYILDPSLNEEAVAALVAKFKAVVEANGA